MDLKTSVIEASDSKTIEQTADDILGYSDDKINVFGIAFNPQSFE